MSEELDENFVSNKEFPFREILSWWEKRRLWFNLLIVAIQFLVTYSMPIGLENFGMNEAIVLSIFYLIVANICYCLGWGIEILLWYYFKSYKASVTFRLALFSLGLAFSALLTYFVYWSTLWYYNIVFM